jgi:hypothetical protein
VLRIFDSIRHRQAPAQQRPKEIALGEFDLLPTHEISRHGEIGNDPVVAAGFAKRRATLANQPIADAMARVVAHYIGAAGVRERSPATGALRLECGHFEAILDISDSVMTVHTDGVVEMDSVMAVLAFEKSHFHFLYSGA